MATDLVIPIVFPDYLIAVNTPAKTVKVPDLIPGFDFFPNAVRIPATKNKLPELGHAGVLFINGKSGLAKYYEYGRYDTAAIGLTRRVPVPDVKIVGGKPSEASLAATLSAISHKAGQRGRISAAYIEVPDRFAAMLAYAKGRVAENGDPKRAPYALLSNRCLHFMKSVVEAGGAKTPMMIDPRPSSYIDELRGDYPPLDYDPKSKKLTIGK